MRALHNFHLFAHFVKVFPLALGHLASTGGLWGDPGGLAHRFALYASEQPRGWAESQPGATSVGSPWCWPSTCFQPNP